MQFKIFFSSLILQIYLFVNLIYYTFLVVSDSMQEVIVINTMSSSAESVICELVNFLKFTISLIIFRNVFTNYNKPRNYAVNNKTFCLLFTVFYFQIIVFNQSNNDTNLFYMVYSILYQMLLNIIYLLLKILFSNPEYCKSILSAVYCQYIILKFLNTFITIIPKWSVYLCYAEKILI